MQIILLFFRSDIYTAFLPDFKNDFFYLKPNKLMSLKYS